MSAPHTAPHLRRLYAPPVAPARGSGQRPGVKRAVVSLEAETFDRIAMLAAASRVTFAEAIRQLIEKGLDDHVGAARR